MHELTLPPDLFRLPAVRAWVREVVADVGLSARRAALMDLLTTEVVSNAIRHGLGHFRVQVYISAEARVGGRSGREGVASRGAWGSARDDDITTQPAAGSDHVVVSVHDDGHRLPQPRSAGADVSGGRGLLLLDALASNWGVITDNTTDDTTGHTAGSVASSGGKTVWFRLDTID